MTEPRAMDYYRHCFPGETIAKLCGHFSSFRQARGFTVWGFGIRPCSAQEAEIAAFAEEEAVRRAIEIVAEAECLTDDE